MMNTGERAGGNDCLDSGYDDVCSTKAAEIFASNTAIAMPSYRFSGLGLGVGLGFQGLACQESPQFGHFTNTRASHSRFGSSFSSDSNSYSYSNSMKATDSSNSRRRGDRSNIISNSSINNNSFHSINNHNDAYDIECSNNTSLFSGIGNGAVDGQPPRLLWSSCDTTTMSSSSSRWKESGGDSAAAASAVVVASMEPWWNQVTFEPDYFQTGKPVYSRTNLGAKIANENHKFSNSNSNSNSNSFGSDNINSNDIECYRTNSISSSSSSRVACVREIGTSGSDCNRGLISGSFAFSSSKRPYSPSSVSFLSSDGVHNDASSCQNNYSPVHSSSSPPSESTLIRHNVSKRSKFQSEVEPSNSDDFGYYNNSCNLSNCSSSDISSGCSISNSKGRNCDSNGNMCLHSVHCKNDISEDSYHGGNLYPSASTSVSIKLLNGRHFNLDVADQDLSVTFFKNVLVERFGYDPGSYVLCSNGILSDDSDIKQLCARSATTRPQANGFTSGTVAASGCGRGSYDSLPVVEMKCVSRIKN